MVRETSQLVITQWSKAVLRKDKDWGSAAFQMGKGVSDEKGQGHSIKEAEEGRSGPLETAAHSICLRVHPARTTQGPQTPVIPPPIFFKASWGGRDKLGLEGLAGAGQSLLVHNPSSHRDHLNSVCLKLRGFQQMTVQKKLVVS